MTSERPLLPDDTVTYRGKTVTSCTRCGFRHIKEQVARHTGISRTLCAGCTMQAMRSRSLWQQMKAGAVWPLALLLYFIIIPLLIALVLFIIHALTGAQTCQPVDGDYSVCAQ